MKTKRTVLVMSLIVVGLTGLTFSQEKSRRDSTSKPVAEKAPGSVPGSTNLNTGGYPVIGHIEKRDRTITIKAGPKGSVYTVKNADGKFLFENLSAEQLRAQAPDLQEFIKTAVASDSGVSDARIRPLNDASVRWRLLECPGRAFNAPKSPTSSQSAGALVR